MRCRKSRVSVSALPHACLPAMRLYEHITEAAPARMAASNGG